MLKALRRSGSSKKLATEICTAISARSREPVFFTALGVPDTIDGRFDLLVLHAWLVMDHLRASEMNDVSQALVNTLFAAFDESLRELGVGDIGIGHRMKKMADAFYGRLSAYGSAPETEALKEAILRNVYRGQPGHEESALRLSRYAQSARSRVNASDPAAMPDFGPLPAV
jgi:cytochrome b pre-mRNA-processing protein 3